MSGMDPPEDSLKAGWKAAVALIYVGAFVQCAVMVAFAASATVLKERLGFTDEQYGSIFLPQIALSALGAIGGGTLARALGLKPLFVLSTLALALSQAALAGSVLVPHALAFPLVLAGTGLMGLGAGVSAAPMNAYPPLLFPRARESALVGAHTVMGAGLTVAPLLASALLARGAWLAFPLLLGAANLALVAAAIGVRLPLDHTSSTAGIVTNHAPVRTPEFWALAAMTFLYALAEGGFSNWAVIFLREDKGLSAPAAALGLSFFWAALTGGRLLVASLMLRVRPEPVWLALPLLMAATLVLLQLASSDALAIGLFTLGGLGCSAFLPLTMGIAARRFPQHVAWVSAMVYAALSSGIGVGSFAMGALREQVPLARLYAGSAAYPLACALLVVFVRHRLEQPLPLTAFPDRQ